MGLGTAPGAGNPLFVLVGPVLVVLVGAVAAEAVGPLPEKDR